MNIPQQQRRPWNTTPPAAPDQPQVKDESPDMQILSDFLVRFVAVGTLIILLGVIVLLWPRHTSCSAAPSVVSAITNQEADGQYSLATANAHAALSSPNLCPAVLLFGAGPLRRPPLGGAAGRHYDHRL